MNSSTPTDNSLAADDGGGRDRLAHRCATMSARLAADVTSSSTGTTVRPVTRSVRSRVALGGPARYGHGRASSIVPLNLYRCVVTDDDASASTAQPASPSTTDALDLLALSEAVRALDEQRDALNAARNLAGVLVAVIGVVGGTLAPAALDSGPAAIACVGVALLGVAVIGAVRGLWPVKWSAPTDAREILRWLSTRPAAQLADYLAKSADEHSEPMEATWRWLKCSIVAIVIAVLVLLAAVA